MDKVRLSVTPSHNKVCRIFECRSTNQSVVSSLLIFNSHRDEPFDCLSSLLDTHIKQEYYFILAQISLSDPHALVYLV